MSRSVRLDYDALRRREAKPDLATIIIKTAGWANAAIYSQQQSDYILWPPRQPITQQFGPAPMDYQPQGHVARY